MALNELVFRKFDLNSLVTFMAVYQTRGVSRAAAVLNVTQPAVSNVLGKLRLQFEDRLFIPEGRKVRPTAKAMEIAVALEPAMVMIQEVIAARAAPRRTPVPRQNDGSESSSDKRLRAVEEILSSSGCNA